jgi:hypothetical protein
MSAQKTRLAGVLLLGVSLGAIARAFLFPHSAQVIAQTAGAGDASTNLAAELETIKGKLPDQAHAMQDVGYHFSNLWFAGQQANWPLAEFYNNEVRSHLRWAVRIIPVRKDSAGNDIDLQPILEAFENGPWTHVQKAIAAKDRAAFDKAYRFTIETCYSCHKASEKGFLRPQIPTHPETPIINFDPKAKWPI